jgi:hypothetical protein
MKLKNPNDHDAVIVNKESNKEEFHKFHGLEEVPE